MIVEAIQEDTKRTKHDDAVIINAAVNNAIICAFGKDKGAFRRFLRQFKDKDEGTVPPTTPLPEMDKTPEMTSLEGWSDF